MSKNTEVTYSDAEVDELLARLSDDAANTTLRVAGRTSEDKGTTVCNMPVIAPDDRPPVGYIPDLADAEFFAAAPSLVRQLRRERDEAQAELIKAKLELAQLRVKPIVDAERQSENLGDIMNLRFTSGK